MSVLSDELIEYAVQTFLDFIKTNTINSTIREWLTSFESIDALSQLSELNSDVGIYSSQLLDLLN